jgi:hypothetical protein
MLDSGGRLGATRASWYSSAPESRGESNAGMAATWIRWTHWAALGLWAAALLLICVRRARGDGGPLDRRLYRFVANPAAFVTLVSLIAILHKTPQHLRERPTQAGILALLLLMGLDHLCERGTTGRRALLTAAGVALTAATSGALVLAGGAA